jgi:hypothetical protein
MKIKNTYVQKVSILTLVKVFLNDGRAFYINLGSPGFCRMEKSEFAFVNLLRSPEIDSPAWRVGTTTLFDAPARQATGWRNRFLVINSCAPLTFLQIRALENNSLSSLHKLLRNRVGGWVYQHFMQRRQCIVLQIPKCSVKRSVLEFRTIYGG